MADRSGKQLGNYRLLRSLGKGGFAEVYLGEHIFLKTSVAVKVLHTQLEHDDMTSFLKEAQTIARLQHAHIVRVTDFGLDGELPYLVMDFAPNGTLRDRHPRGVPVPLATVSSYVKQVAEALQYAHDEKLIHRDIKPENMLLARNHAVLLSDFGIATVAHRTSTQNTSVIAGTAVYMSPELFRGKSYPASDQYALGVVVYEWLAGEPPFYEGDFIQLGYQHTYVPPDPLSVKTPSISREVESVVNIALAKDPKQRFGSVQAFANALEQASQVNKGYVPPVRPTPPPKLTPTLPPPVATEMYGDPSQPYWSIPAAPGEYKPPIQQASFASTGSYAGAATSGNYANPKPVTSVPIKRNENLWRIGKKQVVAIIVGSIIFGVLNYGLYLILTNHSSSLTRPFFSTSILQLSVYSILFYLITLLPLFFGSIYGPWVGLVIFLVRVYIFAHSTFIWELYVGEALIGFISGLALIKTKGTYATLRPRFTASFICILALIIGYGFYYFLYFPFTTAWRFFLPVTLSTAVLTLILLPILLAYYNRRVSRSRML